MEMSTAGRQELTEDFEGCRLEAYRDSTGVWTIGYGHTGMSGAPFPRQGLTISKEEADSILATDLHSRELTVEEMVHAPLTQFQFDALVDFVFNEGSGNFEKSSLLQDINAHNYGVAANQFTQWDKASGVILPGLLRRREAERLWFLKV